MDTNEGQSNVEDATFSAQAQTWLSQLKPKEQIVVERRYGFDKSPGTYREIGAELGMTGAGIQMVEHRALAKLRLMAAQEADEDYMNLYPDAMVNPPETTAPTAKALRKGDCANCVNGGTQMKVCKHSGYSVGSDKALRFCVPLAPAL